MEKQRLFVGNLPSDTSEISLQKLFKKFKVSDVEIKRKSVLDRDVVFAYVNINKENIDKCVKQLNGFKWKNQELKIETAKESFLNRLKRERSQSSNKEENNRMNVQDSYILNNNTPKNKKIKFSSNDEKQERSSNNNSDDEPEISHKRKLQMFRGTMSVTDYEPKLKVISFSEIAPAVPRANANASMKRFENFSSVWKDDTDADSFQIGNNSTVLYSNTHRKKVVKTEETNADIKTSKYHGEIKRRTAVDEKWNAIKEKKNLIKNALKNINSNNRNEIKSSLKLDTETSQESKNKIILFNEDSADKDTFEPRFETQSFLQGKKGLKYVSLSIDESMEILAKHDDSDDEDVDMLRLWLDFKSKFATDERFKINERFFDADENISKGIQSLEKKTMPGGLIPRYDPSKEVDDKISQSQTPQNEVKPKKSKKKLNEAQIEEYKRVETAKPEVSKEKHYSISENLKEAFKKGDEKESFSLSALFDARLQQNKRTSCEENIEEIPYKKIKFIENSPNETSSSEEEMTHDNDEAPLEVSLAIPSEKVLGKCGVWGETFFFKQDDSRLQEAASFYQGTETGENNDFGKKRKQLRSIVRKKIQNSRRDKKLFKQRLGGRINKSKFKMRLKRVVL